MAKKTEELKPKKIKKNNKVEKKENIKKVSTKTNKKKQTTTKKIATSSKITIKPPKKKKAVIKFQTEYYDLPHKYDKTLVTVLSQTPTTLFVYWEMSDDIQNEFKKLYGDNFFEVTKPILIVYNDTLNYSFEIEINDFANSWYIHINDPDCNYRVELGRKPLPIANQNFENNIEPNKENKHLYIPYYVYISSSNNMTTPNNKILFNFDQNLTFRNIKSGNTFEKNIQDFKFITNLGIYEFNELYKTLYPDEDLHKTGILLDNPSSGGTSSSIIKKGVI